jgi:hypothetical protein
VIKTIYIEENIYFIDRFVANILCVRNLLYINFFSNRVPDNNFGDNEWPLYDKQSKKFIEINGLKRNSNHESGPRLKECQFWRQYFNTGIKHEEL